MKNQLIQALAAGFSDAGCECSVNYPGFHSNELHDELGGGLTSVNERTAYAFGWGACLGGVRTVVSLKNVGLNDAADPFLNSLLTGVNAGLVVALFDDCDGQHSQNRMDSRPYFDFFGGLWFDPFDIQNAYRLAYSAFELSERFDVPVVIRITNILYGKQLTLDTIKRLPPVAVPRREVVYAPERFVVHPAHAAAQEHNRRANNERIAEYIESLYDTQAPANPLSVVIYGAGRDVCITDETLRLYTLPLPQKLLHRVLADLNSVTVHEHGQPYVAHKLAALFGKDRIMSASLNNKRLRFKYHCRTDCETLFRVLQDLPNGFVCGDLGGYTMDPQKTINACLCYGASVAIGMGMAAVSGKKVVCVTGDAAFLHSGQSVLPEALQRRLDLTIIVLANDGARGTGGQVIPGATEDLPAGVILHRVIYERFSAMAWRILLEESRGVTVIIAETTF